MNSRNYKYALLLVAAVSITAAGAMSQAYAQSVDDGMDGYVAGTSGIYTGNPNECWYDDGEGGMLPCMVDTGDMAWMLTATSLVLFMTPRRCILLWRFIQIKERSQRTWHDLYCNGSNVSTMGSMGILTSIWRN